MTEVLIMQVVLTVNAVITRNYALTVLHHNYTVITRNWARHRYTVITLHHYGRNYAVGKSAPLRLRVITAVITLSVITRNHCAHTLGSTDFALQLAIVNLQVTPGHRCHAQHKCCSLYLRAFYSNKSHTAHRHAKCHAY